MTARVVLNDASFGQKPLETGDVELLTELAQSFLALRAAVPVYEEGRVVPVFLQNLYELHLPGGTRVAMAIKLLEPSLRTRFKNLINQALPYAAEDQSAARVFHGGSHLSAIQLAWQRTSPCWSLAFGDWSRSVLPVVVENDEQKRPDQVINVWSRAVEVVHRQALDRYVEVLPEYDDDGRHDPKDLRYVSGKSHIPRNARGILRYARSEPGTTTWWARCEDHRFYHRYKGTPGADGWMKVHWNGTTNPNASGNTSGQRTSEHQVPIEIRRALQQDPAPDCGCREL